MFNRIWLQTATQHFPVIAAEIFNAVQRPDVEFGLHVPVFPPDTERGLERVVQGDVTPLVVHRPYDGGGIVHDYRAPPLAHVQFLRRVALGDAEEYVQGVGRLAGIRGAFEQNLHRAVIPPGLQTRGSRVNSPSRRGPVAQSMARRTRSWSSGGPAPGAVRGVISMSASLAIFTLLQANVMPGDTLRLREWHPGVGSGPRLLPAGPGAPRP